jgi:hypothetical protein
MLDAKDRKEAPRTAKNEKNDILFPCSVIRVYPMFLRSSAFHLKSER